MNNIHVFLNGDRGLATLRAVVAAGHGVAAVYAPPHAVDKLNRALEPDGLTVEAAPDVNAPEFIAGLRACAPDLLLIAGYSQIFKAPLLAVPRFGAINLHAGRLPQYRGGSPLNWQIIMGEAEAGLSVIRVGEGIDDGDVLAEAALPIGPETAISDLHEQANLTFPGLTLATLSRFDRGDFSGRQQQAAEACYWHQRCDDDGRIHWRDMTARQVHDLVRALSSPYPGAFSFKGKDKLRITSAAPSEFHLRGVPGRVCRIQNLGLFIICRDRAIAVKKYRFEAEPERRLRHGDFLS